MSVEKRRIYLEEADKPPPSYYDETKDDVPLRRLPFQVPDPQEWLKAPAFVPRPRDKLEEAFGSCIEDSPVFEGEAQSFSPYIPNTAGHNMNIYNNPPIPTYPYAPYALGNQITPMMSQGSMPPLMPGAPLVPQMMHGGPGASMQFGNVPFAPPTGYSANITHINAGIGPPIPAIVLRKKRRRRNRQTHSMAFNSSESPSSSHPTDPNGENSGSESPNGNNVETTMKHLGGSCPDLTEEQLEMWDDYLYDATVNQKQQRNGNAMQISGYEIISPGLMNVAEESVRGISNPEIRKLDKEINGNSMTSSMILQEYSNQMTMTGKTRKSDGTTAKSLAEEMEQLTFRPELTKYGYPQIDAPVVHMASFHHDTVKSSIVPRSLFSDDDPDRYEEDCFEGMNITVNAFDACDDLTLSDVETTNRFEQIHQALKRNSQKYTELRPPDRVCCTVM